MKSYPTIPRVANAPEELFEGHLWLLEKVDGAQLRFQLQGSGLIRFGTRERVFDDPTELPLAYQHAVRHVRERLDRDALRQAVDDVTGVTFFGVSTHRHTVEYDWERLPPFLGIDVHTSEQFLPPDRAEGIFERLGLEPVNAVEREVRGRDFDPNSYEIPPSAWYDGPAAGVVIRNKRGGRAKLLHPASDERDERVPVEGSSKELAAKELAARYATERRFERVAARLRDRGEQVTFDALYDRVLEEIAREAHPVLPDESSEKLAAFRSAVAALTGAFLEAWDG